MAVVLASSAHILQTLVIGLGDKYVRVENNRRKSSK